MCQNVHLKWLLLWLLSLGMQLFFYVFFFKQTFYCLFNTIQPTSIVSMPNCDRESCDIPKQACSLHCLHKQKELQTKSHISGSTERYMSRLMTKPTKWRVPSEDSDQPGCPPSLISVFTVRMKKRWVLGYPLSAKQRLWSDQTGRMPRLIWVFTGQTYHFVGFVMRQLIIFLCIYIWRIINYTKS